MTAPPGTNTSNPLLNRPPCVVVVQASVSARATRSAKTESGITANKSSAMIPHGPRAMHPPVPSGLPPAFW